MKLLAAGCLSEPQNRLFALLLEWLRPRLGASIEKSGPEDADLVYMCGWPTGAALDRWQPLLAPVLTVGRYQGRPVYFSDLILRPGFSPPSWDHLAGSRIAYNEETSFSGWAAPWIGMRRRGVLPEALTWIATGSHAASLVMVAEGRADLAAIDSVLLDLSPPLPLSVFGSLGPWPSPPISIDRRRTDLAEPITSLLVSMGSEVEGRQLLDGFGVSHLAPVDPADYRALAHRAASAVRWRAGRGSRLPP
jgi:phosphonate transport system substrate-binding protein